MHSSRHFQQWNSHLLPTSWPWQSVTYYHLKEFRQLLPEAQAYSNQDVLEHFQESCELLERVTIAKTWSMPSEHVQTFAEMTPLFFHVNKDTLDLTSVTQLTVAGELLIGRIRDDKQS